MSVNLRLPALFFITVLLGSACQPVVIAPTASVENRAAAFTSIEFVSNIETIGVAVSGVSLPSTAELSYRRSGEVPWRTGHPLLRIDDGRLIGSLFDLLPASSYEIRVRYSSLEIQGSAATQPDELSSPERSPVGTKMIMPFRAATARRLRPCAPSRRQ